MDGMEVALCVLSPSGKLQYAGARRPVIITRKQELIELNASKFSIGEQVADKKFEAQSFDLQPGDCLYLFPDGYADQFGGEKGKKFKYRRFQELLQSLQDESMERQLQVSDQTFTDWKGTLEQVDDVCVVSVRIQK